MVHVGKEGVSAESIAATNDAFNTHELLKVRVLKSAPTDTKTTAAALAEATQSDVAGQVGFTFLIYRPNTELKERIAFPRTTDVNEE
jgi:RNA-binding protein